MSTLIACVLAEHPHYLEQYRELMDRLVDFDDGNNPVMDALIARVCAEGP